VGKSDVYEVCSRCGSRFEPQGGVYMGYGDGETTISFRFCPKCAKGFRGLLPVNDRRRRRRRRSFRFGG
jgi:ribosomal protein S27AE